MRSADVPRPERILPGRLAASSSLTPEISRRTALALGAGTLAAASVPAIPRSADASAPAAFDRSVRSVCEMCFWRCGIEAHVRGERLVQIVGSPDHPLSRGKLCPRGPGGTGIVHDPDRLVAPLIRTGERGSEVFRRASWDEALSLIASRLAELRAKFGPETLAMFNHGAGASWFRHLVKAFGSDNIAAPSFAQCRGPRDVAFDLTFGTDPGSPEVLDIARSRCLVLIGSHLGENMHNTQVQDFADAIARGVDLIVVDPRFSTAASKARTWLPIRPGTDTALMLSWMHVILGEGRENVPYLEKHARGLEELRAYVKPFTPEWASVETGLDAESIRDTARRIAGAAPASLIHPGRHATWYGADDTHRSRAMAILNALVGSFGHAGGLFTPNRFKLAPPRGPKYPQAKPPADRMKGEAPFALEPLTQGLMRATVTGEPYPIKAWLVYGTNLIQAMPERKKVLSALSALDLLVVVDVLPSEIAAYADVVLPEASYLERYDDLLAVNWKRGGVAIRQPVLPPPGEAKPGSWIARELGHRMGLAEYFPHERVEDYLKQRCADSGVDWDTLRRDGVVLAPPKPTVVEEGLPVSIPTESGKIELVSDRLRKAGFPPLPVYNRPAPPPRGYFRLLYGRAPAFTFGRTANNRDLCELNRRDRLWLNATLAKDLGLEDGARVRLVNQDGVKSAPMRLKCTERIRADCVYMVHGWGHTAKGLSFAKGRGADDSELVTRAEVDPVMGGTGMRGNFVSIIRDDGLPGKGE